MPKLSLMCSADHKQIYAAGPMLQSHPTAELGADAHYGGSQGDIEWQSSPQSCFSLPPPRHPFLLLPLAC